MDIRAYLRDMDREEEEIRTTIMRLQIRIQQLNDARLVLMQREEERAHHSGHLSPFGTVTGEIVVRDRQKMMPPEKPQRAASLPPPAPREEQLPIVPATPVQRPQNLPLSHRDHRLGRSSLLDLINQYGPISKPEIIRLLGGVHGQAEAEKLSKTLSNMRAHKALALEKGLYSALKSGTLGRNSRKGKPIAKPDPERAERERQAILDVLAKQSEPLPSGDVMKLVMGGSVDKNKRDRLYWALKSLRDSGRVQFRDGLYRIAQGALQARAGAA